MSQKPILSGMRWTVYTSVLRRLLTLVLFYFVARWLSREDLGVFREYSLILALLALLAGFSLDFHYIIEQKHTRTAFYAMWQISIISALVGSLLLTFLSGWLGTLYKSPLLADVLRYTSIFLGIEIIRRAVRSVAAKHKQFKQLALAETYNVVFYCLVTVAGLAFIRSLWIYILAFYLGNLLETLYLWLCNKREIHSLLRGRILRLGILLKVWRRQAGFSLQATLVSVVNTFSGNAPVLFLGTLVNPLSIGLYYFASQLVGVPVGTFTTAVNQVFFPVFAEQRDKDIAALSGRYLRLAGWLGLPLLLLFTYLGMLLTAWLFSTKWMDAIPLLPPMFLLFGSSLYVNPISGIPFVKRKPGWELTWNLAGLGLKLLAMLWGLRISFLMAIWAFSLSSVLVNLAFFLMAMHLVGCNLRQVTLRMALSLLPAVAYALILLPISSMPALPAALAACSGCLLLLLSVNFLSQGKLHSDLRLILMPSHT